MKHFILSLLLSAVLLSGCRTHKAPPAVEPVVEAAQPLPKHLVLSIGPADLKDQWEGHSISTHDQLGADRCAFSALQIGKDAWLHATTVAERISVGGDARFCGSRIAGPVCVQGTIHATASHFSDIVDAGGDVTAVNTTFCGLLQAKAEIIDLTDVKAQSIYVKATGPYYDKQLVYIKGNTVIEGDVIFESERGRVIYDIHARVKGSIRGGHELPSYECDRIILESNR